jgi:hypothetical protein
VWRIDRDCMWADWREQGREVPLPCSPDAALVPIRPEPGPERFVQRYCTLTLKRSAAERCDLQRLHHNHLGRNRRERIDADRIIKIVHECGRPVPKQERLDR